MNVKALAAVLEGIGPVVRDYVAKSVEGFGSRIKALEERALVPGPAGPAGEPGPKGDAGERGADGAPGAPGERGADGAAGPAGEPGAVGERGEKGLDGLNGADGLPGERGLDGAPGERGLIGEKGLDGAPGRDGRDGFQGLQGEKGLDGKDGRDGVDGSHGRDGTLENLKVVQVSDRVIRFCFKDGTPIEGGEVRFGHPIDRGMFKDAGEYEQGDVVGYGGALWIAQRSTAVTPGTGSLDVTGWRLAVPRGRDGKKGDTGPRGEFVTVKAK